MKDKAEPKAGPARPELDRALLVVRAGDQLDVTKLDRLGRSLEHLIALSNDLRRRRRPGRWRPGDRHLHRGGRRRRSVLVVIGGLGVT